MSRRCCVLELCLGVKVNVFLLPEALRLRGQHSLPFLFVASNPLIDQAAVEDEQEAHEAECKNRKKK